MEDREKRESNVSNTYNLHTEKLSLADKFALFIAQKIGTLGFFGITVLWSVLWVTWNVFAPNELIFDTPPTFEIWVLISSGIQLLMLPLILIGQNIQDRHDKVKAEHEYRLNQRTERETRQILEILEDIKSKLNK